MVELTEWERLKLSQFAASNALTYLSHYAMGKLRPNEVNEMGRWEALSEKLKASTTVSRGGEHG